MADPPVTTTSLAERPTTTAAPVTATAGPMPAYTGVSSAPPQVVTSVATAFHSRQETTGETRMAIAGHHRLPVPPPMTYPYALPPRVTTAYTQPPPPYGYPYGPPMYHPQPRGRYVGLMESLPDPPAYAYGIMAAKF